MPAFYLEGHSCSELLALPTPLPGKCSSSKMDIHTEKRCLPYKENSCREPLALRLPLEPQAFLSLPFFSSYRCLSSPHRQGFHPCQSGAVVNPVTPAPSLGSCTPTLPITPCFWKLVAFSFRGADRRCCPSDPSCCLLCSPTCQEG